MNLDELGDKETRHAIYNPILDMLFVYDTKEGPRWVHTGADNFSTISMGEFVSNRLTATIFLELVRNNIGKDFQKELMVVPIVDDEFDYTQQFSYQVLIDTYNYLDEIDGWKAYGIVGVS